MRYRQILGSLAFAVLASVNAPAATIGYSIETGVATGVLLVIPGSAGLRDGLELSFPVSDYLKNKSYSAELVTPGSAEKSEAFTAVAGSRELGFGSALALGTGDLEVGVSNGLRAGSSAWWAVSRTYYKVKNESDDLPLAVTFSYIIQPGELSFEGIRHDSNNGHVRVDAAIDYVLLSPHGPFGGTYDETTGNLLDFFVDIDPESNLTQSDNATVAQLVKDDTHLKYRTAKLSGTVAPPLIPPRGELTLYYDMEALLVNIRAETGGHARLGDPTQLFVGEGEGLVVSPVASQVPEPATMLLLGGGLIVIGARRRRFGRAISSRLMTSSILAPRS